MGFYEFEKIKFLLIHDGPVYEFLHVFFKKNQIFTQNLLVLAYSFIKNRQFVAKIDQNSVFLGHDPHILDR
jgi:hypothetical protein